MSPASRSLQDQQSGNHQSGSAVAEFALAAGLLLIVALGVFQVALYGHVRSLASNAAAEGARYAALLDRTADDGAAFTRERLAASLNSSFARDVTAQVLDHDGLKLVEVKAKVPLPLIGYLGPAGVIEVTGHALIAAP